MSSRCYNAASFQPIPKQNHGKSRSNQKSRFPRGRDGYALSARHQGQPQRNAADCGQAVDSIRSGRGRGRRLHRIGVRYRPQQTQHRRPFRQGLRAGNRAGAAPQNFAALTCARYFAARCYLPVYPPGRGLGLGACRAVCPRGGGQRALCRDSGLRKWPRCTAKPATACWAWKP